MAGHSKWKNTKRRKVVQDMKKGKLFSKLIRQAQVATREGGEDIVHNTRLRVVLQKALSKNMAKRTFNRAILHTSKEFDNKSIRDILYEGYGPGGAAVLLKCLTNNNKRLVSEIRYLLSKFGGNLGISGSVTYLFSQEGIISCMSNNLPEDFVIDIVLKIGANDITINANGIINIYVDSGLLQSMEKELKSYNIQISESKIVISPYVHVDLNQDDLLKLSRLINMLKKVNGVCGIYHNAKFLVV